MLFFFLVWFVFVCLFVVVFWFLKKYMFTNLMSVRNETMSKMGVYLGKTLVEGGNKLL